MVRHLVRSFGWTGKLGMRDFHLLFCFDVMNRPYTGLIDLLDEKDIDDVQPVGGAYVLGTSDGTMLTYPWGTSPVFYIGQSNNLLNRLITHRNHIRNAIDDFDRNWRPRYQYGAAYGADCVWYSRQGREQPVNIEARLVNSFYYSFGAIPVANSVWPQGIPMQRAGPIPRQ